MGAPLNDITIYYNGHTIKDGTKDCEFRRLVNYITDFYHDSLNGYKPLKTSRITIQLGPERIFEHPKYFGSICTYDNIIDESKYLNFTKKEKYKYILEILHTTILEIADYLNWDKSVFTKSYNHILNNDFKFEKEYSAKKIH
jgi:hypothetical protein